MVYDKDGTKLVEKIIDTIARDPPTEKISCKVRMLGEKNSCKRMKNLIKSKFSSCFEGAVATYINQSGSTEHRDGKQLATLAIKNDDLTADTTSAINFEQTSSAIAANNEQKHRKLYVSNRDINRIVNAMEEMGKKYSERDMARTYSDIKPICERIKKHINDNEDDGPHTTLEAAISAIR